jgi:CheY-like chemotaxis protein
MESNASILVIEDSDEDFEVIRWSLETSGFKYQLLRATRSEDVWDRLASSKSLSQSNLPRLIMLDLSLPGLGGREILRQIKTSEEYGLIPVVILSTSNNPRDIRACYQLGASGYICKPLGLTNFSEKIKSLIQYWFETVEML